jgi:CRP-like cAMP-binding protein
VTAKPPSNGAQQAPQSADAAVPRRAGLDNGAERLRALLVRYMPQESAAELVDHHTALTFSKGSTIYLQGAPADVVYWIRAGMVDLYCPDGNGNRLLVRLAGPGEFVGYTDSIDQKGRRCQALEAHARTNCQLALVTHEHLRKILRKLDSDSLVRMMEQLVGVWAEGMVRWARFVGLNYHGRLEFVLTELAMRFGAEDARGVLLLPQLSHADLAEMIGSSRPMVSRVLADLSRRGMLTECDGHFIIARNSGLIPRNFNAVSWEPIQKAAGRKQHAA